MSSASDGSAPETPANENAGSDAHMRQRIEAMSAELTATERRLAAALLADWPFAGLDSIQKLAERTAISAPTITRFVHKLGCRGFQEFQRNLIEELREGSRSPVDLHVRGSGGPGTLAEFARRAAQSAEQLAGAVTEDQFRRICDLLADESRSLHIIGGRISDALALHLSRHLRQMRRGVFHLPSDPEQWPEYLLRMRPRDVMVLVDFRRYQPNLLRLARMAARDRKAGVVLITDRWLSPIAGHAREVLPVPTEVGTAWDTSVAALALIEAMIVNISDRDWTATRRRIESWDALRLDQDPERDRGHDDLRGSGRS